MRKKISPISIMIPSFVLGTIFGLFIIAVFFTMNMAPRKSYKPVMLEVVKDQGKDLPILFRIQGREFYLIER